MGWSGTPLTFEWRRGLSGLSTGDGHRRSIGIENCADKRWVGNYEGARTKGGGTFEKDSGEMGA